LVSATTATVRVEVNRSADTTTVIIRRILKMLKDHRGIISST
jgi:hypothetical protein